MMDDRMDRTIDEAAAAYHAPPAPPRDEMWRRIEAARRGTAAPQPGAAVLPFRRRVRRFALPVGIAALLALGFGLGRVTVDDPAARQVPVASGEPSDALPAGDSGGLTTDPAPADLAAGPDEQEAGSAIEITPRAGDRTRRAPVNLAAAGDPDTDGAGAEPTVPQRSGPGSGTDEAITVAARQHLAQAESFLALFRSSINAGQRVEPVVPVTARHLLASNRLLIDSRAAQDPAMRRLLSDVELVLAQIAQIPADSAGVTDERLITEGMEQRDLLLRIRAAAGDAASAPYQGVL